ncbi:MAG: N-acetylmuramoyl-L-alanine amidase [Armatimonadota bacterium]
MKPQAIVVHCSASEWGDAAIFREWHLERGWCDIGYHAVILNGHREHGSAYRRILDGKIEPGRKDNVVGAHCKADDMNAVSLGVCLVGMPGKGGYPTDRQIEALIHYLSTKCRRYRIPVSAVTQHSDHEPLKPFCASLDMPEIRRRVAERLGGE